MSSKTTKDHEPIFHQALLDKNNALQDENRALKDEVQSLRARLEEAEELRRAISEGDLDALVIPRPEGELIFTLDSADQAYRVLVETMNEGTATLAFDGTILYCNRRFAELLRMPIQAIIGTSIYRFIAPEDSITFKALLDNKMGTGEANLRAEGGKSLPVYLSISSLQVEGSPNAWCLVVTDLTEQKKNEEIVAAERLARSIIEQSAETIIVCDTSGRIIRFSKAMLKLCGCDPTFQLFEDFMNLRSPEGADAGESILPVSSALKGSTILGMEATFEPDSQKFHFILNSGPLKNDDGEIIGCVVTITDITERKQAEDALREASEEIQMQSEELEVSYEELQAQSEELEVVNEALRESEERFRTMANAIPQLAWIAEADGYIYWYNERWYSYTGTTPEQMKGWGWQSVHDPALLPKVLEQWKASIALGQEFDMEFPLRGADGLYRQFLTRGFPLKNAKGQVLQWFGTNTDITERKHMEEALKEARDTLEEKVKERTAELEEAYNSLLESEIRLNEAQKISHLGNWDWNPVTDELYWSDEVYRIFGLDPLEFGATYDAFLKNVHPDDRNYVENVIKEALLNGKPYEIDYRITRADEGERIIHAQVEIVFDEKHTPIRVRGTIQDITERKKAEEEIRKLADVVESSNDAIVTESLEGIITSWNKGAEQVYGYSAKEILGKDISILEPANLRGEIRQLVGKIKQGRKIRHYDTLRLKKDGTLINVSITLSPVFNASGELVAVSAIVRDITERVKAEEAVRLSNIYNRSLIEVSPDPLVTIGLNGKITDVNSSTETATGRSRYELIGTDFSDYFTEPEKAKEGYQLVFQKGLVRDYQLEIKNEDGRKVPVLYNASVYKNEAGEVVGVFAAARDITERKKAEEALEKIEKIRIKEIHHRIKNNLQVISSLLDLQAETFEDETVKKAFREGQDRVISMALIHEELYKGEGTDKLDFSTYLPKLAESLFQTYSLSSKNVRLCMDLEENTFFDMDTAVPLGIIVNELVSNSLKHAFPGRDKGKFQIKLRRDEKGEHKKEGNKRTSFTLTVSDNGVGIPENLEIEDPDTLGLQLVTSLVDQLDGKLELKRNNGTEFTMKFTATEK